MSEVERLVEAGDADAALAAVEALPRELDAAACVRRLAARAQKVRAERLSVEARGRLATARRCIHAGDFEAAARKGARSRRLTCDRRTTSARSPR